MNSQKSIPDIKSIPFNNVTILIVFLMLVGAGIVGYLNGVYDFAKSIRMPDIFVQEFDSEFADTSSRGERDCNISTFTNKHNSSPLPNGDDRFACFDGTYYYCSGNTENKWADKGVIQVQFDERRGDFVCGEAWDFNHESTVVDAVVYEQVQGVEDSAPFEPVVEPVAPVVPPPPAL